jgi:hypothetical protein
MVQFPDSTLNDDSNDGQGKQNLDTCRDAIERGDWNVIRYIINLPIIILALGIFDLNRGEQMKLYSYFCRKGWSI